MSKRMDKLKEAGLVGCLNETDVTSKNYKQILTCPEGEREFHIDRTPYITSDECVVYLLNERRK